MKAIQDATTPSGDAAPPEMDEARAEAFGERMVGVLNDACLALMTSIGHQVGLFDILAGLPPATSARIADASGLRERYVREWLGAMTTSGVVEYDPTQRSYRLPPEHATSLTRAAGPDNLARVTQYIPLMAGVESHLVTCFREGGGVSYAAYERFHRLMAEESAAVHDAALIESTVPLVPGLAERLSAGIDVADVGCGSGHAVNLLAAAFPASRFVGYDFSEEGIDAARREADRMGLGNATFERRDVTDLGECHRFDLICAFDAIHDQAHPAQVLAGIAEALRDDGVFLMVDIQASSHLEENLDHLLGPFLYTISTMHCMTVSLALDGDGLGTVWGEQLARQMLADAGFVSVEWPERSPSRRTSMAATCSTSTRVVSPSTSISGRNDAGRALRDVGAARTTDRGRSSSAWTTTPKRSPCCSWPMALGSMNRYTSPRSTQRLHQAGNGEHLPTISFVRLQGGNLSGELRPSPQASSGVDQCRSDRLGP